MDQNLNALETMLQSLKHDDAMIRENAAYLLGEMSLEALALSKDTLKSSGELAKINPLTEPVNKDKALRALEIATVDSDPWVRGNAADALGKLGSPKSIHVLTPLLKDEDKVVRYSAVEAMGRIGTKAVVEHLVNALMDGDWSVRLSAAKFLSNHPDQSAEDALRISSKDVNRDVRDYSMTALAQLS